MLPTQGLLFDLLFPHPCTRQIPINASAIIHAKSFVRINS
jgi:hypothetical protein